MIMMLALEFESMTFRTVELKHTAPIPPTNQSMPVVMVQLEIIMSVKVDKYLPPISAP
jgi:hypothetical protein